MTVFEAGLQAARAARRLRTTTLDAIRRPSGPGASGHMAARPPWDAATDTIIPVLLAVLAAISSLPWLADAERRIA